LAGVGEREDRIARNEALFRDVNERVRELASRLEDEGPEPIRFVCECGQADCAASLPIPLAEYERIRARATQFVVAPGHEVPEVERIVERNEGYDVVRKHAEEARIAIETDPRA
jgi:hypothetical protein